MINPAKTGLLIALALACAACSSYSLFESKKIDYRTAAKLPPLEIPPDLSKAKPDDRFSIPDAKGTSYSAYSQERGNAAKTGNPEVLPAYEKVRLERAGAQRWIVVPGTPESLWGTLKDFFREQGLTVKVELPEAGVMETEWAENRMNIPLEGIRRYLGRVFDNLYSSSLRDKFRARLERGIEPGTTEIYISHRGAEEVFTSQMLDQTRWQPRPSDPELEAELLGRLMAKLGVKEERVKTLMAEQGSGDRARVVDRADGTGLLEVSEPFDRAWRRVGLALDRVGFTVEDRDRAKGLYFVRYVDPEIDQRQAEKGFFSRLFSSAADKKAERYRVEVKDVKDPKDTSQVQVQNNDGAPDKSPTGKKILALLHDQLK